MSEINESENGLNSAAAQNSQATVTWLKITAICNFITQGFSVITMLIVLAVAGSRAASSLGGSVVGIVIGVYLAMKLWSQAKAIENYSASGRIKDYEESLQHESAYWMTVGILTIIGTVAITILALVGLAAGDDLLRGLGRAFR